MEAIISSTKVRKIRGKDVLVSYCKPYIHALNLLKQEQQKINNHAELSKDISQNSILTSVSSPEIKVSSVRKQKSVPTSKYLPQFKTEGIGRDGDDIGEDERWNENMEMDTQDCTGGNDEGTDNSGSDDDSDDLSQYKPITLVGNYTKNSDDFSQDHINEIKYEGAETGEDDEVFSVYGAIELEDERGNDDDFSQYSAIKLENEVTDTSDDEGSDFLQYKAIELEGYSTKTGRTGEDDGDENDNFSQYRAIELEEYIYKTDDEDDLSQYKPIELEDGAT
jgi:hypothetical protein